VSAAPFRGLLSLLLAAAIVSLGAAQPSKGPKPGAPNEKKPAAPVSLPPADVIAIYENAADALEKLKPYGYFLKPEKYKGMIDEIERLRELLKRPQPTPSKCLLKGKIDGGLVSIQAQFEFVTEEPGDVVRLACGLGQATGITLDGRTPQLLSSQASGRLPRPIRPGKRGAEEDPEGFAVRVEKPGDHQLTLDLVLALESRAGGQGFTLDLPRAASTRLEMDLPAGVRDVRVGGKSVADARLVWKNNQVSGALGIADRLDLVWKSPQAASASTVLAADGVVQVRLDKTQVATKATLTLRVMGGQARQWRLLVPKGAEVKTAPEEARVARIEISDNKQTSLRTLHLKEPTADPLTVTITSTQPGPKPGAGKPTPIGPFSVVEAVRQSGSVLVSNVVADWHLECTPHADLARRAATDEELKQNPGLVAVFRYGPGGAGAAKAGGAISWLDLDVESVRGQIKTRSSHLLRLESNGNEPQWQVQTTITVTPRWSDVDRVMVQMPEGCEFTDEGSFPLPPRVRNVPSYDKSTRLVKFELARGGAEPSLQPFKVKVEGIYSTPVKPGAPGRAVLSLPRPQGTIEQDSELTVRVPPSLELEGDLEAAGLELLRQTTHEQVWRCPRRGPERVPVSWRPFVPPVTVSSLVDVTFSGQEARVRQELRYQLPEAGASPPRLVLRVPEAIGPSLRVLRGGKLERETGRLHLADLQKPAVVLEYTFSVPGQAGAPITVPLVAPDRFSRGETRVRIWSESSNLQTASTTGWVEQNIEEVPGRSRLPVLVLRAARPDLPLVLRSTTPGQPFTVLIDRSLVRVEIDGGGVQTYRVSYRIARLAARHLDFELPAPMPTIGFAASLNGKRIDPALVPTERAEQRGKLVRLRLSPDLVRKPAILDVSYQLTPDRTASTPISTTLEAPRMLGGPGGVPTRWQIVAPSSWVVIAPEGGPGTSRVWSRRGWLFSPRSNLTSADLERWLANGSPSLAAEGPAVTPTLALWHESPTVRLTHAPQQAWLLTCSLVLVLLGLLLSRLPFTTATGEAPRWAWLLLAVLVVSLVLGVLLWPTLAGQVAYGCQPGAAVLLLMALLQWLLHERYRRQIVFLPSFSRTTPSSLLRKETATPAPAKARGEPSEVHPPGEPSTVDAPAK
jgi:hypothetical protein